MAKKLEKSLNEAAEEGRGGDSLVGHLTPGDVIIPKELHTPEMLKALHRHFSTNGTTLGRFTAGSKENSINPKTGQPEFGFLSKLWKGARDAVETVLPIVGDYFLPGSSLVTDKLVSKGAQKNLNSPLGQIGQVVGSAVGGGIGSDETGIPASGGYTAAADALGNVVGDPTLGTDIGNSLSSTVNSIGNTTGLSDLFGGSGNTATTELSQGFGPNADVVSTGFGDTSSAGGGGIFSSLDPSSTGTNLTDSLNTNYQSGTVGTPGLSDGGFKSTLSSPVADAFASSGQGATVPGTTSLDNFMKNPGVGSAWNMVKSNPSVALNAAGLAVDALKGNKVTGAEKNLQAEASNLNSQGQELQQYLQNGTLPPGLQAGINQAAESAKAQIRSKYASMGMSGSSAEQQELSAIDQRSQAEGAQIAMQLLQTGINETGAASQLYQELLNNNLKSDADLQKAISNFTSSFDRSNGSGGGTTIRIGS